MGLREVSVELGSDCSGFAIEGLAPSYPGSPVLEENTLLLWRDEDPELQVFSVMTGSQWGPFDVVLRAHDTDPGPAGDAWEDLVEVSVEASGSVSICEIVDGPVCDLEGVVGEHRMRVSARGRTESAARDTSVDEDDLDAAVPLEHFVVDLWPAPAAPSAVTREDSQYAKDSIDPPAPDVLAEEVPGLEAAWAIIRDVRGEAGARLIPDGTGTVVVEREFPGTATKIFNRVRYVFGWPPCNGGMGSPGEYSIQYSDATIPVKADGYDVAGFIATGLVEIDKPRRIVRTWNWVLPGPGPFVELSCLLPDDGTVTVEVVKSHARGEEPRALVRLTHAGAPGAWVEELEKLWAWDLARWAAG